LLFQPKLKASFSDADWQKQLANAFTSIEGLCAYLELNKANLPVSPEAAASFQLRVPLAFAERMEKGNPNDPLLRQVLPISDETLLIPGYKADPVGDVAAAKLPGLLHKYQGRVLLINTGACAINCRYCFRRNFPYQELQLSKQQEVHALDYIRSDETISEVILSGGDPLLLSDERLKNLFRQLEAIDHIQRIRIHSRLPIVLPARITQELAHILQKTGKSIVLVVHCNHANEINGEVIAAIDLLKNKGITLLNQAVLLSGVNDHADVLCSLSEKLFAHGILPYYLHLLDKASGTGHFAVPKAEATALMKQIQNRLPGYLVPRLVEEIAGGEAKQVVA
jgi:EF-P beta-lysylation protein EpmB